MTRKTLIPKPQAVRSLLIALNVALRGSLQAKYRLAAASETWLGFCRKRTADSKIIALASQLGVPGRCLRQALALAPRAERIARPELAACNDIEARIVTLVDPDYPQALLDLELPPPVLYVAGDIDPRPALSIVGSRRSDPYGLEATGLFAREVARQGFSVVSGLALGVDAAAHRAALSANGHTLAVLGCGLDILYPRGNQRLARKIRRSGALITEFPLGAAPEAWRFPIRNRMIAALAMGTLVVRATPRSGSLITARHALDLGREIFAIPGNVFDQRSVGPNALIRDGAHPVQHPREILEILSAKLPLRPARSDGFQGRLPPETSPRDPRLARVLELLPHGVTVSEEEFVSASSLPIEKAQAALLELEIGGWIERHPGARFIRSHASSCYQAPS